MPASDLHRRLHPGCVANSLHRCACTEVQDLGKPAEAAITSALEKSFLDRVVPNLGLVVTLYDILSIGDGYVYPSDGGAHYRCDVLGRLGRQLCCRTSMHKKLSWGAFSLSSLLPEPPSHRVR
jgi:hypothetical protein